LGKGRARCRNWRGHVAESRDGILLLCLLNDFFLLKTSKNNLKTKFSERSKEES
jgi:hypothetical protein